MDMAILLGCTFVVFLLLGVPVAISIGLASVAGILVAGLPLSYLAQTAYTAVDEFTIIAVPMFILAGALMERGGLTERLIAFSRAIVGPVPGGLATVTIVACTLFAAISGSGPATTAAIGSIMIPAMVEEGYSKGFAGGISSCAGGIGVVIPPSIPMIIYGITSETSITGLFMAGVLPGVLLALALYALVRVVSGIKGYRAAKLDNRSFANLLHAAWQAKWALLAPLVILGGIYLGVFTVTEASVVAVFYALFTGIFIFRTVTLDLFIECVITASRIAGSFMLVLTTGRILGRLLTIFEIPQLVSDAIIHAVHSPAAVILLIIVLLLFVGMWMETLTQIIILTPLLLPVAQNAGLHPIQFGVLFTIACEIGYSTPPLGVNLFVASEIADESLEEISKSAVMFVSAQVVVLICVGFFPELSLFIPRALGLIN